MSGITTYIIVFDASQRQDSWMSLNQYIKDSKDFIAYWNYIPLVYMVKTRMNSTEISTKLQLIIPGQHFMVSEVNPLNSNGLLPKSAWDWINADHSHTQPEIGLSDLVKSLLGTVN